MAALCCTTLSRGRRRRLPLSRLSAERGQPERRRAAGGCARRLRLRARAGCARPRTSRSASASAAASPPRSPRDRPLDGLILVTPFDSLGRGRRRPLSLAAGPPAVPPRMEPAERPRGSPHAGRDHRRRPRHADPRRRAPRRCGRRVPISSSTGRSRTPATTTSTTIPIPRRRCARRSRGCARPRLFRTCRGCP